MHAPSKRPFMGDISVIINRGSFSTTSDFAALTHFNDRATFVGEETGGSYAGNTSNFTFLMTLPNTKIRINIPVARYQTNVTPESFGRGIIPDISVQYSIDDYLNGVDKDLETILSIIRKAN